MLHPIIKTGNYILITSDELVEKNYGYSPKSNEIFYYTKDFYGKGHESWVNIIAHLPLNNSPILEDVPLLPPLEVEDDVDLICEKEAKKFHDKSKHGDDDMYNQLVYEDKLMIKIGYKKAKEKYKFTEEDMIKVIDYCKHNRAFEYDFEKVMESLSQPKLPVGFKCEIEVDCTGNDNNGCFMDAPGHNCGCVKTKIINGVMQGQWIY